MSTKTGLLRKLIQRVVLLPLVLLSGMGTVSAGNSLLPTFPAANQGEACVEPTDVMRRSHFEFILHQRDETMHKGIRTKKHSLKNCVSCHVSKDDKGEFISVNDSGQFCQSCHAYAAVKIDCFECHATVPTPRSGTKARTNPHK